MPRSGSTMLQAVLSNNSDVRTTSEPWICLPYLSALDHELQHAGYNSRAATNAISEFLERTGGRAELERGIGQILLKSYEPLLSGGGRLVLDKTPRYYEILPQLRSAFPDARIIVLKRHPVNALDSMIRTWHKKDIPSLSVFERDLLHGPQLMHDFLLDRKDDPNVIEVKYEDLLADPSGAVRSLYEQLGLSYSDDVLDYSSNQEYKGKFGDQKGAPSNTRMEARHEKPWADKVEGTWYEKFAKGYAHHLGQEFLEQYGGYSAKGAMRTKDFRVYEYAAQHGMLGDHFSKAACRKLWWYEKFGIGSF